jgi:predicted transcriptional regulator
VAEIALRIEELFDTAITKPIDLLSHRTRFAGEEEPPLGEMLTDLRRGLWTEIYSGAPIDAYRRRLQATYVEAMASKIKPPAANAQDALLAQLLEQTVGHLHSSHGTVKRNTAQHQSLEMVQFQNQLKMSSP